MLTENEVAQIAAAEALKIFGPERMKSVRVKPEWVYDGSVGWDIRVVWSRQAKDPTGREILRFGDRVWRSLVSRGDERFPYIRYVDESELAELSNGA